MSNTITLEPTEKYGIAEADLWDINNASCNFVRVCIRRCSDPAYRLEADEIKRAYDSFFTRLNVGGGRPRQGIRRRMSNVYDEIGLAFIGVRRKNTYYTGIEIDLTAIAKFFRLKEVDLNLLAFKYHSEDKRFTLDRKNKCAPFADKIDSLNEIDTLIESNTPPTPSAISRGTGNVDVVIPLEMKKTEKRRIEYDKIHAFFVTCIKEEPGAFLKTQDAYQSFCELYPNAGSCALSFSRIFNRIIARTYPAAIPLMKLGAVPYAKGIAFK